MDITSALAVRDAESVWHPFTHLGSAPPLIPIVRGEGALLYDANGKTYIDAISSWWVNLHGHAHPYIAQKVSAQLSTLEHVLFAGFTHEPAIQLSERLLKHAGPKYKKVFFSDDGSTSVEVALKLAFQYWQIKKEARQTIVALTNAYHGDTFGAMAAGARGLFTAPFQDLLFEVVHIDPTSNGLSEFESLLQTNKVTAFIYEPLVQGAGGMNMYEPTLLNDFLKLCEMHKVISIADEVMTGFYRTGKMFASDHVASKPDLICLSKGLTGGTMPMGVTLVAEEIFSTFEKADRNNTFFHGHSFTANPLACVAANASLDLLESDSVQSQILQLIEAQSNFKTILGKHSNASNARNLGTITAVNLQSSSDVSYTSTLRDRLYEFFIQNGVVLRPLGNVIYVLPPYCITSEQLEKAQRIVLQALEEIA